MKNEIFSPYEAPEGVSAVPAKNAIGGKQVSALRKKYIEKPYDKKFSTERVRNRKGDLLFAVTAKFNDVIPVFLGNAKMVHGKWAWHNYTKIK